MRRPAVKSTVDGAAANKRAEAEAVLLERLALERVLTDLTERLVDAPSADFLVRVEGALRRLVEFLGYDRCTFSEFVAGDYLNVLCSVAPEHFEPLPRGRHRFPLPWFLAELRDGRVVAMSDLPGDLPPEAVEEVQHCRLAGLRSHLSIPLRMGGRVTSVLSFAAVRQTRSWPPEMIARLKMIGEVLCSSLALARSEEETRELRQRVWHADRVLRVGALSAAIAHELNQPLAAILSNAQAGLRYLERDGASAGAIKGILESVVREDKRAAETIRTMRALIRQDESQRECIDLGASLGEAKRLLESEFAAQGVCIDTRLDAGCWVVANKMQVEQVGLNLMFNAAAAMRDTPPARRVVRLQVSKASESRVVISVQDAGRGISAKDIESVFEPFWSTRQEGLGLGLAICRSIVEAHGGRIWAVSNAQGGATFNVELPAARDEARPSDRTHETSPLQAALAADLPADHPSATAMGKAAPSVDSEEVLVCVIDDDAAVRDGLLRLLDEEGWTGAGYASADEFLANPPAREVACLLLDVRMPGLSGPQLQQCLLERGCAPSIIFLTGHGNVSAGIDAMKHGAADFLEKPADADVVLAAVRRAVERHVGARRHVRVQEAIKERLARLSPRERETLTHVLRGRLNKQIAADLLIAEQTVKQHRGRVMEKMGVRSVAELVHACEAAGLLPEAVPATVDRSHDGGPAGGATPRQVREPRRMKEDGQRAAEGSETT